MAGDSRVTPSARSSGRGTGAEVMGLSLSSCLRTRSRGLSEWSCDGQLGLRVADDRLAVLFGHAVDDDAAAVLLAHRRAHDDLMLGQPHAPELHAQALEALGPAGC